MVRTILTDDHKLFREGVIALFAGSEEILIAGQAANGVELLTLMQSVSTDVVLLDIHMPEMDGFETLKAVKEQYPHVKVLILTMFDGHHYMQRMMQAGADGYLLKNTGKQELVVALQLVVSGVPYISPSLTMDLLYKNSRATAALATLPELKLLPKDLSGREKEVLQLISEGYTNVEISEKLFTSKRTIETHRQNLLEKTNTRNTAALIKFAVLQGIVS
ncbi:response regulator [Pontibacter sp. CAU 1760]